MQREFKGLLIDFDDTLVPYDDASDAVMGSLCMELSGLLQTEPEKVKSTLLNHAEAVMSSMPVGGVAAEYFGDLIPFPYYAHELLSDNKSPFDTLAPGLEEFRVATWSATCESLGAGAHFDAEELAGRLVAETSALRVPYEESTATLQRFSGSLGIAILTNGRPEVQLAKVERSGLDVYLDHVVPGAIHGSKPHPRAFEAALGLLGCEPYEAAMVGDNIRTDVGGAQKLGIFSVWLNRNGRTNETDIIPDAEIQDLGQLIQLLRPTGP